jgi:hypothetical protein
MVEDGLRLAEFKAPSNNIRIRKKKQNYCFS